MDRNLIRLLKKAPAGLPSVWASLCDLCLQSDNRATAAYRPQQIRLLWQTPQPGPTRALTYPKQRDTWRLRRRWWRWSGREGETGYERIGPMFCQGPALPCHEPAWCTAVITKRQRRHAHIVPHSKVCGESETRASSNKKCSSKRVSCFHSNWYGVGHRPDGHAGLLIAQCWEMLALTNRILFKHGKCGSRRHDVL